MPQIFCKAYAMTGPQLLSNVGARSKMSWKNLKLQKLNFDRRFDGVETATEEGKKIQKRSMFIDDNGNINCINCVNCRGCVNCRDCTDCQGSVNCINCKNCNRCVKCTGCLNLDGAVNARCGSETVRKSAALESEEEKNDNNCVCNCKKCVDCRDGSEKGTVLADEKGEGFNSKA